MAASRERIADFGALGLAAVSLLGCGAVLGWAFLGEASESESGDAAAPDSVRHASDSERVRTETSDRAPLPQTANPGFREAFEQDDHTDGALGVDSGTYDDSELAPFRELLATGTRADVQLRMLQSGLSELEDRRTLPRMKQVMTMSLAIILESRGEYFELPESDGEQSIPPWISPSRPGQVSMSLSDPQGGPTRFYLVDPSEFPEYCALEELIHAPRDPFDPAQSGLSAQQNDEFYAFALDYSARARAILGGG